jgi:hypothetical protein
MRIIFSNRFCTNILLTLLPALLLSGCFMGLFGGGKKDYPPEMGKTAPPGDKARPAGKQTPSERAAAETLKNRPASMPREKLLAHLIDLKNPEYILPLAIPTPSSSRTRSDAAREESSGTARSEIPPRPPNFSYRDGVLTEDTTWHGEVLIEGGLTIAPQTTLTVKNGTVVRFRGSRVSAARGVLMVQGRIVVNGSTDSPAIFTAAGENAAAGGWQGIVLMGSGKKNLIENCRVEGAETGLDASFSNIALTNAFFANCRTGARMQDSLAVMSGGGAGECGTGLILYDCEADIHSADFYGNRLAIFAARSSLSLSDSRLTGNNLLALSADSCKLGITGSSFIGNGSGLCLIVCEGSVTANRIAQSAAYGLILSQSRVKVSANEIARNGKVGLWIEDGKGVAWGNSLFANGDYDLYNFGMEEFRAIGNWWGGTDATGISGRIYDQSRDNSRGRVLYLPVLQARPLPAAP